MKRSSKLISICLCFILESPHFAFAGGQASELEANTQAVRYAMTVTNQALESVNVKFFDSAGKQTTLIDNNHHGIWALLPSSPSTGLKKPLGIKLRVLSLTPNGITAYIVFTDEKFSQIFTNGFLTFDFGRSPEENKRALTDALGQFFEQMPQEYFAKNEVKHEKAIADLFLPKANAIGLTRFHFGEAVWEGIVRVLNITGALIFASMASEAWHLGFQRLPFSGKFTIVLGSLILGSMTAQMLLDGFSSSKGCSIYAPLSPESCITRLGVVIIETVTGKPLPPCPRPPRMEVWCNPAAG